MRIPNNQILLVIREFPNKTLNILNLMGIPNSRHMGNSQLTLNLLSNIILNNSRILYNLWETIGFKIINMLE
jgi:hypothetical protein